MVDTDEVFRSLPHVLNQASQDHFSPFLHRGSGGQSTQIKYLSKSTDT